MAFISSGVEYALHCLLYLAEPINARGASVRDLAALQDVPYEYLAKIFTKMHKAEIVIATEGIKGGFSLAKSAEQITIHDVIVAIDNYKPLFECKEIRSRCAIFNGEPPIWSTDRMCAIHQVMQNAEQQLRLHLTQQTLASLAQQLTDKAPDDYSQQVIAWLDNRIDHR